MIVERFPYDVTEGKEGGGGNGSG